MKKLTLLLSSFTALLTVSCVHVTKTPGEVFQGYEKEIEYHDMAYMKSRRMEVPHNVDENNYKQLKFIFGFKQNEMDSRGIPAERNINHLSPREWETFCQDFEHGLERTKRFATAQMLEVLADDAIRKYNEDGIIYLDRLDPSKMHMAEAIVHVRPTFETSEAYSDLNLFKGYGKLRTTTLTMKLICTPLQASNNEVLEAFQSLSVQTNGKIINRLDKYNKEDSGLVPDDTQSEAIHQAHGSVTLIKAIHKIYSAFPVGGPILNFDPDDEKGVAIIKASADDGVLPEMQFVIYAMKKSDGDAAIRVPLFNATLVTLGRTGNSTLRVWRENTSSKTAKEIIKKFRTDFNAAKREYDFYGCSDGLAEWPTLIIDRPFADED